MKLKQRIRPVQFAEQRPADIIDFYLRAENVFRILMT